MTPSGINRVVPAAGFSLSELDDAGINLDAAEQLGLPIDIVRVGAYGPNVTVLRDGKPLKASVKLEQRR